MNNFVSNIVIFLFGYLACPKLTYSELFKSTFEMEALIYSSSNLTHELENYFEINYLSNKVTKK